METQELQQELQQEHHEHHEHQTYAEVSWDNIEFKNVMFSDNHKVCLGATSQIIYSLQYLSEKLEQSKAENPYQEALYPALTTLAKEVISKYEETFTNNVSDPVQKQVFGANLNGVRNNGTLRHPISTRNVRRDMRYKFIQFGQQMRVLTQRLDYIVTRNVDAVERYKVDQEQRKHFIDLQTRCAQFLEYLNGKQTESGFNGTESVSARWTLVVQNARTVGGNTEDYEPKQVKLTSEEVNKREPKTSTFRTMQSTRGSFKHTGGQQWETVNRYRTRTFNDNSNATEEQPYRQHSNYSNYRGRCNRSSNGEQTFRPHNSYRGRNTNADTETKTGTEQRQYVPRNTFSQKGRGKSYNVDA